VSYLDVLKEVWDFTKENKKWWLVPVIMALAVIGFLILTAGTAPVPVFVYPVV
jgi:hypothetical protein